MDHLQRSSCNASSITFRNSLQAALTEYFEKNRTPQIFQTTFLSAVRRWLYSESDGASDPLDNQQAEISKAYQSQERIGLRLMTRGLLFEEWRADQNKPPNFLQPHTQTTNKTVCYPTQIISNTDD